MRFYETAGNVHGLRHDPFKAIVSPRPIGWIGTRGLDGSRNLSPYSFFNIVADDPKIVMFAAGRGKGSPRNAAETGVFTVSLVSRDLVRPMNESSIAVPYGVDEFAIAGLTPVTGQMVDAPYVGEAHAALECRVTEILHPRGLEGQEADTVITFGQVVGIHIDESIIRDGRIDMAAVRPVGRMGYMDYCDGGDVFEMMRPKAP
ncbi:flavin reductase family protein [Gellertiella hungarica]|uniref:Flavin reductase (DIM6/NTAB) family NADH-FMN oxidoreductase RutF n=1 Tax=Gellertiella hungarica TaxID=1572859 RepID=A0A7W6J6F3_9HYPH|nr:flavin reductase family protein [Gellertiella hungarica]MBB4064862.1 flavin reductase (DIM6/NTAB) family NADH-FMN oxidoreductase RutF [Gellertiella hungarica]